jgi:hypothetical protein
VEYLRRRRTQECPCILYYVTVIFYLTLLLIFRALLVASFFLIPFGQTSPVVSLLCLVVLGKRIAYAYVRFFWMTRKPQLSFGGGGCNDEWVLW